MNTLESSLLLFLSSPTFHVICLIALLLYAGISRKTKKLPRIPLWPVMTYLVLKIGKDKFAPALDIKNQKLFEFATSTAYYCAIARLAFYFGVERYYLWKKKLPLPTISRDFSLIIIYAVIALIFMRTKGGINLAGILTTSAVMTAAIGFAAQNTLSNLFSGLSIQLDNPFAVGDWICVGESAGQVMQIGWKSTEIKTLDDEIVSLPNLEITKSIIKNYSRPTDRLVMKVPFSVDYKALPSAVESAAMDACRQEPMVVKDPAPALRLARFDDSSIAYELRIYYHGFQNRPILLARLNRLIYYSLKRAGIDIPYPIRDIRHHHVETKIAERALADARCEARRDLDAIPLIASLGEKEKDDIAAAMDVEIYTKGEAIVFQGDAGDSAFLIHDGSCIVRVKHTDGVETDVATLPRNALFGEMSLLTGATRTATVIANEDSTVFRIGKAAFGKMLAANPNLSEKLAEILSDREAKLADHAEAAQNLADSKSAMLSKIKKFFGIS